MRARRESVARHRGRVQRHDFLFRRVVECQSCGYSLIGEVKKGHQYYRCHTKICPTTGIREEAIAEAILRKLSMLKFGEREIAFIRARLEEFRESWKSDDENERKSLNLRLSQILDRTNRLTDAFIDGAIDRETFEQRKTALSLEKASIEESLSTSGARAEAIPDRLSEYLELAASAWLTYRMALPDEKRDLLGKLTSNLLLNAKHVVVELRTPFSELAFQPDVTVGAPNRDIPRTWERFANAVISLNDHTASSKSFGTNRQAPG